MDFIVEGGGQKTFVKLGAGWGEIRLRKTRDERDSPTIFIPIDHLIEIVARYKASRMQHQAGHNPKGLLGIPD